MRHRLTRVLALAGAFALAACVPDAAASCGTTSGTGPARSRIGLALGGGAARGIAHVGFLMWLDEHRIPVDCIAGTSVGALVGGGFAIGMSPAELQQLMNDIDWPLVFLADSPFRYKNFRRKQDARAFPSQIEFGLKHGFSIPSGLNAGEQIELLFNWIALPYSGTVDFDELPTPFRSVAADLHTSTPVVFASGSLSRAMRATMAIPGFFTPVVVGEQVLVDGGALNNVPVDVARTMGADVVIAVNVGSATDKPPPPTSVFGVLGQTIDTMMQGGVNRVIGGADLVVTPDLRGFGALDWRRTGDLVARGYAAAEAMSGDLLRYQVDEASYAEWRRARNGRRRAPTATVAEVIVEGLPEGEARRIREDFERRFRGKPIDRESIEEAVLRLMGSDRYEVVGYHFASPADAGRLVIRVAPKAYGPPFLFPAVDFQNVDASSFAVDLRARVAIYDALLTRLEVRIDLAVGSEQRAEVEFYRRLGRSGLFVAARGGLADTPLNAFDSEGDFTAQYREQRTGGGLDIGIAPGIRDEIRAGYDVADVRTRRRIGEATLPEPNGSDRFASIRWIHDGQTSPVIPTRGLLSRASLRHYFHVPTIEGQDSADLTQAEVSVSWFQRWNERHRLFLFGAAGTSFGDAAGYHQFRLGGPLALSAFNLGEVRGDGYGFAGAGALRNWFRLPDVIGGSAYFGGWLEGGSAANQGEDARHYADVTVGVVVETILGPFFVGEAISLTNHSRRFYVSLAPFVR